MLKNKKIVCLITARQGSKGIKNKNIKTIGGKPLILFPIKASKKSKYVDEVFVSTDSKKYQSIARKFGAKTPFLRPKNLSGDKVSSYSVIKHFLNYLKNNNLDFDILLLLEPTSPFTSSKDIDNSIKKLIKNYKKADSLVSASKLDKFDRKSIFEIKNKLIVLKKNLNFLRRQDKKNEYFLDGSLYISKISSFKKNKGFISNKTITILFQKWKSLEIDDNEDLIIVKAISKYILKNNI